MKNTKRFRVKSARKLEVERKNHISDLNARIHKLSSVATNVLTELAMALDDTELRRGNCGSPVFDRTIAQLCEIRFKAFREQIDDVPF